MAEGNHRKTLKHKVLIHLISTLKALNYQYFIGFVLLTILFKQWTGT